MSKRREAALRAPRLEDQLCFALYSATRAFTRAYQPLLEPLGLTYPQYLVMLVLWEGKSLSVTKLGERLGLDSGTLTPLLKRLAQAKLVKRRRDDVDERVVMVSLSAAGLALQERAANVPVELACRAGFRLDSDGLAELQQARQSIRDLTRRIAPLAQGTRQSAIAGVGTDERGVTRPRSAVRSSIARRRSGT